MGINWRTVGAIVERVVQARLDKCYRARWLGDPGRQKIRLFAG
jgi:hypothetical protein